MQDWTDGALAVLRLGANAADHDGLSEFGADYVLLGVEHYREQHYVIPRMATVVLKSLDVSLAAFAQCFAPRRPDVSVPRAKASPKFAAAAEAEAARLPMVSGHNYVGTEHLLLAVAATDSLASRYLRDAGADYDRIRRATKAILGKGLNSG